MDKKENKISTSMRADATYEDIVAAFVTILCKKIGDIVVDFLYTDEGQQKFIDTLMDFKKFNERRN